MRNKKDLVTSYQFQCWLEDMPDSLIRFKKSMPTAIVDKLDFSLESLDVIEKHLLDNYQHYKELKARPSHVLDGYAVYVGETFRKELQHVKPNQWELMLDEENVFYNLPVINIDGYIGCPITLVTACISRKRGNYLSTILRYKLEDS